MKAAISRAAHLQECLFGELPRYIKVVRKKSDPPVGIPVTLNAVTIEIGYSWQVGRSKKVC